MEFTTETNHQYYFRRRTFKDWLNGHRHRPLTDWEFNHYMSLDFKGWAAKGIEISPRNKKLYDLFALVEHCAGGFGCRLDPEAYHRQDLVEQVQNS